MAPNTDSLRVRKQPAVEGGTLVLAFSGWMDGGDVSTGTVNRLVELLGADPFAEIDPDPYYIYNFPGSMELSALFRPHIEIENGLIKSFENPSNTFYYDEGARLVLFVGKEPNIGWRSFGECIFKLAKDLEIKRILFVGSFGGTVPHTRQPRLYVTCSDENMLPEMEQYGVGRTGYEGPGSFTGYLLNQASAVGIEMASLVVEIPGYLQGTNPVSIEAVTRRLAKILELPLDLDSLRLESTQWEFQISSLVDEDEELAAKIREMERDYDNELLENHDEE